MGCCGTCLKSKVTKFILRLCFSHIGLFLIVLAYTVIGAFIFRAIEYPDEYDRHQMVIQATNTVNQKRSEVKDRIIILVNNSMNGNQSQVTYAIREMLQEFHDTIKQGLYNTSAQSNVSWPGYQIGYQGGVDIPDEAYRWGITSAILFTATILTTIGYGHVYPFTQTGYMVFLIYSVFAIPLMSMFLMNISSMLVHGIRIAYHHGCCFWIEKKRKRLHEGIPIKANRPNAVFGENGERPRSAWSENGLQTNSEMNHLPESERQLELDEELDREREAKENSNVIPAALSALIVVLYITIGTFVYHAWEGWTLTQSAYFGVVTLMTIGFGDLVPGLDKLNETRGQVEIGIAALYIIVGLAILAMGISLVMAAMVERFKTVAMHIEDKTGLDVVDGYEGKKSKKAEVEPLVNEIQPMH